MYPTIADPTAASRVDVARSEAEPLAHKPAQSTVTAASDASHPATPQPSTARTPQSHSQAQPSQPTPSQPDIQSSQAPPPSHPAVQSSQAPAPSQPDVQPQAPQPSHPVVQSSHPAPPSQPQAQSSQIHQPQLPQPQGQSSQPLAGHSAIELLTPAALYKPAPQLHSPEIVSDSATRAQAPTASKPSGTVPRGQPSVTSATNYTRVPWYQPRDPGAPTAIRDPNGRLIFIFSPLTSTSTPTPPVASSQAVPSRVDMPSTPTTPPLADGRPESPRTPAAAVKRTLAQDILRSLGRPQGAFGDPLVPTPAPLQVIELSTVNGKRGPSPEGTSPTPAKRQRLESVPPQAESSSDGVQPDAVISTAPTEQGSASDGLVVEPLPSEPAPEVEVDLAVDHVGDQTDGLAEVEAHLDTPVIRAPSITSSELADVHQVQESIFVSDPDSDASGPSFLNGRSESPSTFQYVAPVQVQLEERLPDNDVGTAGDVQPSSPYKTPVRSPARVKEKVPLFLPSPSSDTPAGPSLSRQPSPPTSETSASASSSSGLRRLFDPKGKGRARDDDSDVEMVWSRDASMARSSPRRGLQAYVLVPPLPRYAKRIKVERSATPSDVSVDGAVAWDGASSIIVGGDKQCSYVHDRCEHE